jgi:hypothetical protein
MYLRLFKAPLFYFLLHIRVFASLLSGLFLLPFYALKDWSTLSYSLSWAVKGNCALFLRG